VTSLGPAAEASLTRFIELLQRWNLHINLVSEADLGRLRQRHVEDALALLALIPPSAMQVADLGSGAGFPGLPLAIARPDLLFTLVEVKTKAAAFLARARAELALENVTVFHGRVEEFNPKPLPDLVVSRAAFPPPRLVPLAYRLLAPGGSLIVQYGPDSEPLRPEGWRVTDQRLRPGESLDVLYRRL
jgi:16S rRNA (guanine527-N7)-methyltransferase